MYGSFLAASASLVAQITPSISFLRTLSVSAARSSAEVLVSMSVTTWDGGVAPLRRRLFCFASAACLLVSSCDFDNCSLMASATERFEATTTKCCGPRLDKRTASSPGPIVRAAMRTGTMMVMIKNDLLRTRSRYSRLAIKKILRIGLPHDFDKDLFQ